MTLRTFFVAVGFAGLASALAACSAPSSDTASSTAAESAVSVVSADDIVDKGSVAVGAAVTVTYDPSDYPNAVAGEVPYLALRIVPPTSHDRAASTAVSIHVEGKFPGSPSVLVLDANDKVVAAATGIASTDVAHADLEVPAAASPQMVLVRDDHWVRPMPFTVSAE